MRTTLLQIYNRTPIILKILLMILISWFAQILFLYEAVNWGMNWDDWRWLFYYDVHQGNDLRNFFAIRNDVGNVHSFQQLYYIGVLKSLFGLNLTIFQLIALLFKSLAALSVGFLIFKLTKDKLFSFLTIFFFIIFPSTAGLLYILTGLNYLIVVFLSFSLYFYIQSAKSEKKIFLASLFFFLALCAGPARAYLLIPIPLFIELIRLKKKFKPFVFIKRLLIFYLPLLLLKGHPSSFNTAPETLARIRQLTSGNLYTLTLSFQQFSTLFIDQRILKDILNIGRSLVPFIQSGISGFLILNSILFTSSVLLGLVLKGKQNIWPFVFKVMIPTLILEMIFYIFGQISMDNGQIAFNDKEGNTYWFAPFDPTVYQASLGGYFFLLGLRLAQQWWRSQRDNAIYKITAAGWLWSVLSIIALYITNYRYEMVLESNDRYTFVSAIGAVVFIAGVFTLSFKALEKIKNLNLRLSTIFLLCGIIFMIAYQDYKYLNRYYSDFNNHYGDSSRMVSASNQNMMYQNFLTKFGKENLTKPAVLYIESGGVIFNQAAFSQPIIYRIFYNENDDLIRNNCKVVISDIKILEKSYSIYNEEKGFIYDTPCVGEFGIKSQTIFYPLSNFYAYRIENKEFIDIKDEIINTLNK